MSTRIKPSKAQLHFDAEEKTKREETYFVRAGLNSK